MKLQVPFIQLPLAYDAGALAAEIARFDESTWQPHPQGFAGNSMLPLVAVNGDTNGDTFAGQMRATPHLQHCPYLMQVLASLGATIGRSRLMRLSGQAEVKRHADQGYYWAERVRVHIPIVTQPTVRFECGESVINMAAGECWIFDTWRLHRVLNDATDSRIHLVVDTVGGGAFWDLVMQGRAHDAPRGPGGWQPKFVAPQFGSAIPALAFEKINVPMVMSPWELNAQLRLLLADAVPHPKLALVQHLAGQLSHQWRGLWAQFGDSVEGHLQFRAALDRFVAEVEAPARTLLLRNTVLWYSAMLTLIARVAISDTMSQSQKDEHAR